MHPFSVCVFVSLHRELSLSSEACEFGARNLVAIRTFQESTIALSKLLDSLQIMRRQLQITIAGLLTELSVSNGQEVQRCRMNPFTLKARSCWCARPCRRVDTPSGEKSS